jgi:hypothetical protein
MLLALSFPSSTPRHLQEINMSARPSKNAKKSRSHLFSPGNPGGPGRPAGSRNAATLVLDQIADGAATDVLHKMIEAAKAGDMRAGELLLSRVWPVRKGRPIALDLPSIKSAADLVSALSTIAEAVAGGALTPDEGQAVAAVLETKRRAIETVELESRISALEQTRKP